MTDAPGYVIRTTTTTPTLYVHALARYTMPSSTEDLADAKVWKSRRSAQSNVIRYGLSNVEVVPVSWFVNEDGEPYPHADPAQQARDFPGDDHTPYPTRQAALDALDAGHVFPDVPDAPRMVDLADVIGAQDVADMAGVSSAAVANWRKRHADFPAPIHIVSRGTPLFSRSEVLAWLEGRRSDAMGRAIEKGQAEQTTLYALPSGEVAEVSPIMGEASWQVVWWDSREAYDADRREGHGDRATVSMAADTRAECVEELGAGWTVIQG